MQQVLKSDIDYLTRILRNKSCLNLQDRIANDFQIPPKQLENFTKNESNSTSINEGNQNNTNSNIKDTSDISNLNVQTNTSAVINQQQQ